MADTSPSPASGDSSRNYWLSDGTNEEIQTSCLQRIADACEKMCTDRERLENGLKMYKNLYFESRERVGIGHRRIIALKGVITRMKRASAPPVRAPGTIPSCPVCGMEMLAEYEEETGQWYITHYCKDDERELHHHRFEFNGPVGRTQASAANKAAKILERKVRT